MDNFTKVSVTFPTSFKAHISSQTHTCHLCKQDLRNKLFLTLVLIYFPVHIFISNFSLSECLYFLVTLHPFFTIQLYVTARSCFLLASIQ